MTADQTKETRVIRLIELVALLAVFIGVAIVFFQQKSASIQMAQIQVQVDQVQKDFTSYKSLHEMPSSLLTPVDPSTRGGMPNVGPVPMPMKSPIAIILPKKGSTLCRDDYFTFSWKTDSKSVEQIRIWIEANIPAPPIADISISYNETGAIGVGHYDWKVGSVQFTGQEMFIPDGDFYRFKYEVINNGITVYTGTSDSFSINTCKG